MTDNHANRTDIKDTENILETKKENEFLDKSKYQNKNEWNPGDDSSSVGTGSDEDDVNLRIGSRIYNSKKYFVCDSKLHEKILAILHLKDLLTCRLVCHNWNKIIGESGLLWKIACMKFSRCLGLGLHLDLQSNDAGGYRYGNSDLIKYFRCPNFSFYHSDLRDDKHRNFFIIHGLKVKFIKIVNCYISKATFDLILHRCPNMEHLEINCVTRSISLCETLFNLSDMSMSGCGSCPGSGFLLKLPKLETLILKRLDIEVDSRKRYESTSVSALQFHSRTRSTKKTQRQTHMPQNAFQIDPAFENIDGENLSPLFLQQLLDSCKQLRKIHLSGWKQATAYNLLNILNSRPQLFGCLNEVHLDNIIGPPIDYSLFFPLCSEPCSIHLKKLTIALQYTGPMVKVNDGDDDDVVEDDDIGDGDTNSLELDSVFQKALELHCGTLVELNLNNLPITGSVFQAKFPKLHRLSLMSTLVEVQDIQRVIELMPELEILDHSRQENHRQRSTNEDQSLNYEQKSKFRFPPKFYHSTSFDNICMISFGSILGILVTILLIFQFETYGQWFIFLGIVLLGVLCTADFLQFHCSHY